MSLADRLSTLKSSRRPKFDAIVEALPRSEREALIQYAADPTYTNSALMRVLREEGIPVGKDTFSAWRANVNR